MTWRDVNKGRCRKVDAYPDEFPRRMSAGEAEVNVDGGGGGGGGGTLVGWEILDCCPGWTDIDHCAVVGVVFAGFAFGSCAEWTPE